MSKRVSKARRRKNAAQKIEKLMSDNGGFSKAALASFGVSWPPPKGWKKALIAEISGSSPCAPAQKKPAIRTGSRNKKPNKFYSSWEWKRLRLEAIKLHGQRCQCCGWRPGDTEHGYLVVDHIKPRSKYPALSLDLSNLQVLCNDCNMGKSNVYEDDFRDVDNWLSQIGREE